VKRQANLEQSRKSQVSIQQSAIKRAPNKHRQLSSKVKRDAIVGKIFNCTFLFFVIFVSSTVVFTFGFCGGG
jgi:hypothetical protein